MEIILTNRWIEPVANHHPDYITVHHLSPVKPGT